MSTEAKFKFVMSVKRGRKVFWYFRRRGFPVIRLPGAPGEPQFAKRWAELAELKRDPKPDPVVLLTGEDQGTLSFLITHYLGSPSFRDKSDLTRRDYRKVLDHLRTHFGHIPFREIKRGFAIELRDIHHETNRRFGNYIVQMLRLLLNYAIDREWLEYNPLLGIKLLPGGKGYQPWTKEQVEKFVKGAKPSFSLACLIGYYTGQRRENVVTLDWNQYDGTHLSFPEQKGGSAVVVRPVGRLKSELDKHRKTSGAVIAKRGGGFYDLDAFSNAFRAEIERVLPGAEDLTFHGLRYSATGEMADAGATDEEIMSVTGHRSKSMVTKYASKSRGKARAERAISKREVRECANT